MGSQKNTPSPSSPKRNSKTLHDLFEQEKPPFPIPSSPASGNEELVNAISYCTFVFTFTDPSESPAQRDSKRLQLTRLISILKSSKKPVHEKVLGPLVAMISANLFRPLPPSTNPSSISDLPEEEDPISTFSPLWSHLQIVYEILLRLVNSIDQKMLREYINHSFLLKLLALFQSEDPRERESLKNVYHKIYSKFISDRSVMRKSMTDVLLNYVFETEKHPGIAELLEIWGTIINGFTVPLKEEHKLFLMRVLIPLHKTKGMQVYHRQLAYCVSQFVQKEPMLGGVVVRGILRYWPVTNCQKEILLIGELEDLVENLDPDQYRKLALPLCTQITKCINSWNSQVAERALYVWNNEQFVKMASTGMVEVFPVIVEGMEKNLKWHWSKSVRQQTESVKVMLEEMDPVLYSKGLRDMEAKESEAHQQHIKRKLRWERIESAAAKNQFLNPQYYICVSH
ncbi:serine/threonine protein phosphatase 2A 57 kDa regulatory subunit B' beta isoform-like [Gastrolobium bilobum]|uniref:serine/threonine protein phosphatase 2A 57 kDa regulatory subunit B' beta isoform-like n=1 Tax=Gastrolobium bilobum TaxID=150636 RepID=UPI002AB1C316|nr:serine/threonine protein phosphatase 2A 57 kDa regulatory subunit B' beta isoform-like [Gastrolobium bilobum]